MANAYFYIKDATVAGKKMVITGDYISPATIEVSAPGGEPSSSGPAPRPQIAPPRRLEVKWILPPKNSPFYDAVKSAAEAAGYETVEHDDFSYPGPRG